MFGCAREKRTGRAQPPHSEHVPAAVAEAHWFAHHVAYTMAKYGMSMCTLGHSAEFKEHGIGVNSLWPRTAIATAALQLIPGIDPHKCRKPEILSDAAWLILTSAASTTSGISSLTIRCSRKTA